MAKDVDYPLWAVVRAQAEGLNATAGMRAFRAGGGRTMTQTWYRLWGEARAAGANRIMEAARDTDAVPAPGEMTPMTTVGATGALHQIEMYVADRVTGEVSVKPFSVRSSAPVRRIDAIMEALDAFTASAAEPQYDERVLGAVHVGAYLLTPGA